MCPAFHGAPKESATEPGVPLHETDSFMQHLQDEILHRQFLLAVLIDLIFSLFKIHASYFQQIPSEITMLYSHGVKISPRMWDISL